MRWAFSPGRHTEVESIRHDAIFIELPLRSDLCDAIARSASKPVCLAMGEDSGDN